MTLRNLSCKVGPDGVAVITLQAPDGTLPLIDEGTIEELEQLVERIGGDNAIKGAVITGADGKLCMGADPRIFERLMIDYRA